MRTFRLTLIMATLVVVRLVAAQDTAPTYPPPDEVKAHFLKQLDRPRVGLDPVVAKSEAAETGLIEERLTIASQRRADGQLERVPILIVRPADASKPRALVIVLHGTGGNKDRMRPHLVRLAERGIVGLAIDARYHGDRSGGAKGSEAYIAAITRAWETKPGEPMEHPFYLDTCWDLWRVLDYVATRKDVDPKRIGMIGFSMGGIQTWLAASVDERVRVAVPAIAVQSFRWSLDHDRWQGRARTIQAAHLAAARDLGEKEINARVCRELWNKIIPGMLGEFDCPSMIRLFAGRPLLVLNGDRDPNCPIEGARIAFAAAEKAYADAGASDRLLINVATDTGHKVIQAQDKLMYEWLERWLAPTESESSR